MKYYLGVDIGTTSVKTVAFAESGEALASKSYGYPMLHPQSGYAEQNPDEISEAVYKSINAMCVLLGCEPGFISFSAAMHGLIIMDSANQPLTNCIIWADNRAAEVAGRLRESDIGERLYHITGVPVHAMSPLCKIIWLRENEPQLFAKAHKFISIKDYLFFKLFGEYVTDTGIASATGLLNIEDLQWDAEVLALAGISEAQLPAIKNVKTIFRRPQESEAGHHLQLAPDVAFVIGSSDGASANLGSGSTDEFTMNVSIGTSGAARLTVDRPTMDDRMRTFCYHLKNRQYIIGGPTNNGAVVLEWLKENILESTESFDALCAKAGTVEAGSNGVVMVPYILGERAPVWDSGAQGIFYGLGIQHKQAHLIRACMEGVIYCVFSIAKILFQKRAVTEIHANGGFTQSPLWVQMLADVSNKKVVVSGAVESSALGAVMLGLEALGKASFPKPETVKTYWPCAAAHSIYQKAFAQFESIYAAIKESPLREDEPYVALPEADLINRDSYIKP